jgi:hypothetical protein
MLCLRDNLTFFYLFEFEQNVRNKAVLYIQNNNQELTQNLKPLLV